MADQTAPAPAAAPKQDRTTLSKIVELAASAAATAEPGSALRALAHVTRLLAARTLDSAKMTAAKFMAHDAEIKKLRSEVDELAQMLVAVHGMVSKPAQDGEQTVEGEAPAEADEAADGEAAAEVAEAAPEAPAPAPAPAPPAPPIPPTIPVPPKRGRKPAAAAPQNGA